MSHKIYELRKQALGCDFMINVEEILDGVLYVMQVGFRIFFNFCYNICFVLIRYVDLKAGSS